MLDCNVLMLSVLTIKGIAVIKPERKAAWLWLYVREPVVISLRSYWSVLEELSLAWQLACSKPGSLSVGHSRRHVGGPTNWDIA